MRLAVLQRCVEGRPHDADSHGAYDRGAGGEGRGDEAGGLVGVGAGEEVRVRDAQVGEFDVRAGGGGVAGGGEVVQDGVGAGVVVGERFAG